MKFQDFRAYIKRGHSNGFLIRAKSILESDGGAVLATREEGNNASLLDYAAIFNQPQIILFLLQHFPDLITPNAQNMSALQYAARGNSFESMRILLRYGDVRNLNHRYGGRLTALEIATEKNNVRCVRILINYGASLPQNRNLQQRLAKLINPCNLVLYCAPGGFFQLLKNDDVAAIEAQKKLANTSLPASQVKNSFIMPLKNKDKTESLLKLMDKFLYYYKRISKENREEKHSAGDKKIINKIARSRRKRNSLLTVIRLIALNHAELGLDLDRLLDDTKAKRCLKEYIIAHQRINKRYYGDDHSDNSDSEDESRAQHGRYQKTAYRPGFWQRTRLTTAKNAGFKDKLIELTRELKDKPDISTRIQKLTTIVETTFQRHLTKRAEITYDEPQRAVALDFVNRFNNATKEEREKLLEENKHIYVMGARGINYMLDRWNADSRRYHRNIPEERLPQFSEAALKLLSDDYYHDLDATHDFHLKEDESLRLHRESVRLQALFQAFNKTPPCIANSPFLKQPYLFDTLGDYFQDSFSNGVDLHLEGFQKLRRDFPAFWGIHLKNSFNTGIAIGARPYHALKYTYGLKTYYPKSMLPRYWNDGTIEHSHVGKVYLSLHPLVELFDKKGPNNVSRQDMQGRVAIRNDISPEKELSFLGYMPGDRVFHQYTAKFPSFKNAWKSIYIEKYGLDKETYDAFKELISLTNPETDERKAVIFSLSEWLCSFHEVRLIELAKNEAIRRHGYLVYVARDGKLSLEAESSQIFQSSKENLPLRNRVHVLRDLRITLAEILLRSSVIDYNIPGYQFTNPASVIRELKKIQNNNEALELISKKVELTQEQDSLRISQNLSATDFKVAFAKSVVQEMLRTYTIPQSYVTSYQNQTLFRNLVPKPQLQPEAIETLVFMPANQCPHTDEVTITQKSQPNMYCCLIPFPDEKTDEMVDQLIETFGSNITPYGDHRRRGNTVGVFYSHQIKSAFEENIQTLYSVARQEQQNSSRRPRL